MESVEMVGYLMELFAAGLVVAAGLSAISPGFLRDYLFWRARWAFDDKHPKEYAGMWAKALLLLALGPGIGGLALIIFHNAFGLVIFLGSMVCFIVAGTKYVRKEQKRIREIDE
ncbi:MAG: hypothetical protein K5770_13160 [Lachnospiraceae bacterium]|jgi:hypothetical protein|nr:hypothetical protein [Lachnospiraceae bacterium]MCR4657154.1 hypothetical protein [Lachnospiraceae bacterium]